MSKTIFLEQLGSTRDAPVVIVRDVLSRIEYGQALSRPQVAFGHPMPVERSGLTSTGTPRIVICLAGKNHMLVPRGLDMAEIVLTPMDVLFIPNDSWNLPTHEHPHSFLTLDFTPTHVRYFIHQREGIADCQQMRIHHYRKGMLPMSILQTIGAMEGLVATAGVGCVDSIWGLVVSLVAQADDALVDDIGTERMTPEGRWEVARQYMEDHLHEQLTRDDVAAVVDIHPNHLSRLFRQFAGESYVAHLAKRRLVRAADWLRKYDMPVGEIGRLCGYGDATHFSRAFKTHFGLPPKRYRMEMSSNSQG